MYLQPISFMLWGIYMMMAVMMLVLVTYYKYNLFYLLLFMEMVFIALYFLFTIFTVMNREGMLYIIMLVVSVSEASVGITLMIKLLSYSGHFSSKSMYLTMC